MKTLSLFNAVIAKPNTRHNSSPLICMEHGVIIPDEASWAEPQILSFYKTAFLNGEALNNTFYKSWETILNSSRYDILVDQIKHYVSTYGFNFTGDIYIPEGITQLPNVKLKFVTIEAISKEEMIQRALDMLISGIALKETTIDDLLSVLVDELGYTFTGSEGIKNKEAIIKIADMYGVLPQDTMEFFRYVIFKATGDSLLIKNKSAIASIKSSRFNPAPLFNKHGLVRLASIYNRFKPLFLAFKDVCPKTINRISKLSKKHHIPLVSNPLNHVSHRALTESDMHWLDNATPFALMKALTALHNRVMGQDTFAYKIRNGKSFAREAVECSSDIVSLNLLKIIDYIEETYEHNFLNKKFYIDPMVQLALPTSEKQFVGNVPVGTSILGKNLAVGVYWENSWGSNDLDLSGLNIGGKVGWNSDWKQSSSLIYSGDITDAPEGAVEYLYVGNRLIEPTLVMCNVFSGNIDCGYKIIVGQGDGIDRPYMMNPNNLVFEAKTNSVQKQTVIGVILQSADHMQKFIVLNVGAGSSRVSGNDCTSAKYTRALYQEYINSFSFNDLIVLLGGVLTSVPSDADYNLSIKELTKDSLMTLFTKK